MVSDNGLKGDGSQRTKDFGKILPWEKVQQLSVVSPGSKKKNQM